MISLHVQSSIFDLAIDLTIDHEIED